MMNRIKKPSIPLTVIACLFFWHFSQKDIAATDIQWQCNSHDCKVSFDLKNKSKDLLYKSIRIRAIQRIYRGKAGGMSHTVLGETTCEIEFLPESTQRMNRAVVLAYPEDVNLITIRTLSSEN